MKLKGHKITDLNAVLRLEKDRHGIPKGYYKCAVSMEVEGVKDSVARDGQFRIAFRLTDSLMQFEKQIDKKVEECSVLQDAYEAFYNAKHDASLTMVLASLGQKVDPTLPPNRKRPIIPKTALVLQQVPGQPLIGYLWIKDLYVRLEFSHRPMGEQGNTEAVSWARIKGEDDLLFD